MIPPEFLWAVQLALASALTGIIWQVQLLTYPQFLKVSKEDFPAYHLSHTARMGFIVVPFMLLELVLASICAWQIRSLISFIGLGLVLAVWLTTAIFQVPLHGKLACGHDRSAIEKLITTNWLRTLFWTLRTVILLTLFGAGS